MIVSAIAAMSSNRVIGKDGGLPWSLPDDMKFFRDKTIGHIMVMGRKTFESFGKPLPKRLHLIISRRKDYQPEGAIVFSSVMDALTYCKTKTGEWGDEIFIVGGGEIYKEALPFTNRIYLTEIKKEFDGHACFPEFNKSDFRESSRRPGKEEIPYDFVVYDRISQ